MKTFEITFTSNPESGIYSANLINAESAEQATAYFKSLGACEVVGCAETQSSPKPGQPIHTVPEGWEAPEDEEEEKAARTAEETTAAIIEFFKENEEVFNDCIEELDDYNGYLGDGRYFSMDELDELHNGTEPSEILRRAFFGYDEETCITDKDGNKTYGAFNPNRDVFRYNAYGNLVSADYKDYSGRLDKYAVESMSENRNYIDTIEYNEELAELFDELEQVEKIRRKTDMQSKKVFSAAKYLAVMTKICNDAEIQDIIIPAISPKGWVWDCDGKTLKECKDMGYLINNAWCIEIPQNENIDFWRNYSN